MPKSNPLQKSLSPQIKKKYGIEDLLKSTEIPPTPEIPQVKPEYSIGDLLKPEEGVAEAGLLGLKAGVVETISSVGSILQFWGGLTGQKMMEAGGKVIHATYEEEAKKYVAPEEIVGPIAEDPALMKKGAWWSYNVAKMLPSMVTALAPGGVLKVILGKVTFSAPVMVRLARLAPYVVSGGVAGQLEGASTYQEVLKLGGSKREAEAAMALMTMAAGTLNALSFAKMLGKMSPGIKAAVTKFLTTGATEGLTEIAEEPAEAMIKMGLGYGDWNSVVEQTIQGLNVGPPAALLGMGGAVAVTPVVEKVGVEAAITEREALKEKLVAELETYSEELSDYAKNVSEASIEGRRPRRVVSEEAAEEVAAKGKEIREEIEVGRIQTTEAMGKNKETLREHFTYTEEELTAAKTPTEVHSLFLKTDRMKSRIAAKEVEKIPEPEVVEPEVKEVRKTITVYKALDSTAGDQLALGPGVYVSQNIEGARGYGEDIVSFEIDPSKLLVTNTPKYENIRVRAMQSLVPGEGPGDALVRVAKEAGYEGISSMPIGTEYPDPFGIVLFEKLTKGLGEGVRVPMEEIPKDIYADAERARKIVAAKPAVEGVPPTKPKVTKPKKPKAFPKGMKDLPERTMEMSKSEEGKDRFAALDNIDKLTEFVKREDFERFFDTTEEADVYKAKVKALRRMGWEGYVKGQEVRRATVAILLEANPDIIPEIFGRLANHFPQVDVVEWGAIFRRDIDNVHTVLYEEAPGVELRGYVNVVRNIVNWSRAEAALDTPPHEYFHWVGELIKNDPLYLRAIELFPITTQQAARGMSPDEHLTQLVGEYYADRITDTSLKARLKLWLRDFWIKIRSIFAEPTADDILNILGAEFFNGVILEKRASERGPAPTHDELRFQMGGAIKDEIDGVEPTYDIREKPIDLRTRILFDPEYYIMRLADKIKKMELPDDQLQRAQDALGHVRRITEAELFFRYKHGENMLWFNQMSKGLSKEQMSKTLEAVETFRKGGEVTDPKLRQVAEDYTLFMDRMRSRYINFLVNMVKLRMSNMKVAPLIERMLRGEVTEEELMKLDDKTAQDYMDIRDDFMRILGDPKGKTAEERKPWGLDDYVSHMERGSWLIQIGGETRAVAETKGMAKVKAREIYNETGIMPTLTNDPGLGDVSAGLPAPSYRLIVGKATERLRVEVVDMRFALRGIAHIKPAYKRAAPTLKRKDILKGEENIFKILNAYSYAIEKKMAIDPVIFQVREFLPSLRDTPQLQKLIEEQLEYVKGVYSGTDELVDNWVEDLQGYLRRVTGIDISGKRFRATRAVQLERAFQANVKLGYRPVAAFVNYSWGHAMTYARVGFKIYGEAKLFLRTNAGKKFAEEQRPYYGVSFALEEGGTLRLKSTIPLWKPLGLFQRPEPGIRETSMAAMYLYAKKQGMSEEAAVEDARAWMRFSSMTYNMASIPKHLRMTGGRLFGQFRSFMIKSYEYFRVLSPGQKLRYVGATCAIGGPKALITTLKSLPVIGLILGWNFIGDDDDEPVAVMGESIEDWIDREIPEVSRGLPGMVGYGMRKLGVQGIPGMDVSAPASWQLPMSLEDLGGVFISDAMALYKHLLRPFVSQEIQYFGSREALNLAEEIFPMVYYLGSIMDAALDDEGYMLNDRGQLGYKLENISEYFMLSFGITPIPLARHRSAVRASIEAQNKLTRSRKIIADKFVEIIMSGAGLSGTTMERLYGDAAMYGLSAETLLNYAEASLTPEEFRRFQQSPLILQLPTLERFERIRR